MKKNSFVEGALIATTAVVISKILGMLYVIPFYQIIGVKGGALYSYSYNIYNIFLGISSAGIPTAISKMVSEYDTLGLHEAKYRTFKIGNKVIGYMSVVAFLIMFIFANGIARAILGDLSGGNTYEDVTFVIRAVSFAVLVIPYLSVAKGYIQGHKIIGPTSIGSVLEQIVRIFVILCGSFLAYKVFNSSLTFAVGIAVSGAFFGGLAAYLYLRHVINQNKEQLGVKKYEKRDDLSTKEIIKKIISYAIPFIIINIASSIYNFTDMVLILRGLSMLGYSALEAEFIQSAITTWSLKISMIVSAFAMGMGVSLIPNIVSAAVSKNWEEINFKMNKAYQMILVISIPCSVGLSILAKPVWTVFYGYNYYGTVILSVVVMGAIFSNLYSITMNTLQALNRFKLVYLSVCVGFTLNALLDIPYMYLLKYLGLPPYLGTIFATLTGFIVSMWIARRKLKKDYKMSYVGTYKMGARILVPTAVMTVVLTAFNHFISLDYTNTLTSIIGIILNVVIGAAIYLYLGFKTKVFQDIFGEDYLDKLIKKLTFNKVSIK